MLQGAMPVGMVNPMIDPACTCRMNGGILTTPCALGKHLQERLVASLDRSPPEYDAALDAYARHLRACLPEPVGKRTITQQSPLPPAGR
jgi:hypothetical protein